MSDRFSSALPLSQPSRVFRLSREIQKLFYQELNLVSEQEFAAFLKSLNKETVIAAANPFGSIAQEFLATCQALGLQPPEKGKLQEWLENLVVAQEASNFTARNLPSGNLQLFLDYLLTLEAAPTEDEENSIAHHFGLEPAHLKRLISRVRFD